MSELVEGRVLAAVLEALMRVQGEQVPDDLLQDWNVPWGAKELSRRYAATAGAAYDPTVVAWLLASCGESAPTEFEVELDRCIGHNEFCAPVWVLSRRVAGKRLPARPVVDMGDPNVAQAYRGLLDHLASYVHERAQELQRTACIWRVGALADGMEPVGALERERDSPLALRVQRIVDQLKIDRRLTSTEVRVCQRWEPSRFNARRNALTHLQVAFGEACTFYEAEETLSTECEAVSLAVLRRMADAMSDQTPPSFLFKRLESDLDWID